jgi:hypothetical protein
MEEDFEFQTEQDLEKFHAELKHRSPVGCAIAIMLLASVPVAVIILIIKLTISQ